MISEHSKSVAEKAKRIYAERLQCDLEEDHLNRFVAIEPESGDYFIADSFSLAVANAAESVPEQTIVRDSNWTRGSYSYWGDCDLNGRVDGSLRALIDVNVAPTKSNQSSTITVWVDTAFDGFFVFPRRLIEDLGLKQEALAEEILADSRQVTLESFVCYVNWFGDVVAAQVIANDGRLPLLGTEFLANHRLVVDYVERTVAID